jgi:hypothetical protein
MSVRFTRVWDANSAFQAHISDGVEYAILPVLDGASIVGFRIYDLQKGELEEPDYDKLHDAKAYVETLIDRREES